ncbi:MAG: DUF4062 domain-containing protein [Candidatus Methylomirabilis sp.]|nr:DUF4062 domain-containing protein [Deltaproteobacteria bacterium]
MRSVPAIMVSSTFYDLRQIRSALSSFLMNDLGYIPLLSELPSFPVNPDLDTVENCRSRVEKEADILVLIIGGRYGAVDTGTEKSITNLEFITARQKGIPIYVFVEKGILSILEVWRNNPDGNFTGIVDTPRLFEFVDYVRSQERVWTFSFESAQDIITVLRIQLAHLFYDSLSLRFRIGGIELPPYLEKLRRKTLKIFFEKAPYWEYFLFFHCWIEEIENRIDKIREHEARLKTEPAEFVSSMNAHDWITTRLHELTGFIDSANHLLNISTTDAIGKPGEQGNAEKIVWVSRMLALIFENILKWASHIRCANVQEPFTILKNDMALFVDDIILQFQTFPKESLKKIEDALRSKSADSVVLNLTMAFKLSNLEAYFKSLEDINRKFSSDLPFE